LFSHLAFCVRVSALHTPTAPAYRYAPFSACAIFLSCRTILLHFLPASFSSCLYLPRAVASVTGFFLRVLRCCAGLDTARACACARRRKTAEEKRTAVSVPYHYLHGHASLACPARHCFLCTWGTVGRRPVSVTLCAELWAHSSPFMAAYIYLSVVPFAGVHCMGSGGRSLQPLCLLLVSCLLLLVLAPRFSVLEDGCLVPVVLSAVLVNAAFVPHAPAARICCGRATSQQRRLLFVWHIRDRMDL